MRKWSLHYRWRVFKLSNDLFCNCSPVCMTTTTQNHAHAHLRLCYWFPRKYKIMPRVLHMHGQAREIWFTKNCDQVFRANAGIWVYDNFAHEMELYWSHLAKSAENLLTCAWESKRLSLQMNKKKFLFLSSFSSISFLFCSLLLLSLRHTSLSSFGCCSVETNSEGNVFVSQRINEITCASFAFQFAWFDLVICFFSLFFSSSRVFFQLVLIIRNTAISCEGDFIAAFQDLHARNSRRWTGGFWN